MGAQSSSNDKDHFSKELRPKTECKQIYIIEMKSGPCNYESGYGTLRKRINTIITKNKNITTLEIGAVL